MRRYYIYLFISLHVSIHRSIYLSSYMYMYSLSIYPISIPSMCLFIHLSSYTCICPSHPSIHPSIHSLIHLSIYLSIYLPQDGCIGVYGESERKFMFKSVIVGHNSKARFRIINSNKVRILVDTSRQQLES